MKLKELLQKVSFDSIIPHIIAWEPEHITQIPYYKEAYDILLHTEAEQTEESITVEWVRDEAELGDEKPYTHIYNCEGDYWATNLGKELVLGENVVMSDEELAGRCMWSLTFYGYRSGEDCFDESPLNCYEIQANKLRNKNTANYLRKSSEKGSIYSMEKWYLYEKRKCRRNRMKRMRDHRQSVRIRELERMGKVEHAIQRILSAADAISREQVAYLFDTHLIQEQDPHSRAYDRTRRMDYLRETLTKYTAPDSEPYTHTIAVLSTSPDCPLTDVECSTFNRIIALVAKKTEVLSAIGIKEELGEEAELFIVKSR